MKTLTKALRVIVSSVTALSATATKAFADGGSTTPTPYGTHIPVPTGIISDNLEVFTLVGVALFVVGLALIVASNKLKEKLS